MAGFPRQVPSLTQHHWLPGCSEPRGKGGSGLGELEDTCTWGASAGVPAQLWLLSLGHFGASCISPGLGVCVSLVSPSIFLPLRVSRHVPVLPFWEHLFRVAPKERHWWEVGGPAHFSQCQAAHTHVFPCKGWCDNGKKGWRVVRSGGCCSWWES